MSLLQTLAQSDGMDDSAAAALSALSSPQQAPTDPNQNVNSSSDNSMSLAQQSANATSVNAEDPATSAQFAPPKLPGVPTPASNGTTSTEGSGSPDAYTMNPGYFAMQRRPGQGDPTSPQYAPASYGGDGSNGSVQVTNTAGSKINVILNKYNRENVKKSKGGGGGGFIENPPEYGFAEGGLVGQTLLQRLAAASKPMASKDDGAFNADTNTYNTGFDDDTGSSAPDNSQPDLPYSGREPGWNDLLSKDQIPDSYTMNPMYYQDADANNSSSNPYAYDYAPIARPGSYLAGLDPEGTVFGMDPITHKPIVNIDPQTGKPSKELNVEVQENIEPHYVVASGGAIPPMPTAGRFNASAYGLGQRPSTTPAAPKQQTSVAGGAVAPRPAVTPAAAPKQGIPASSNSMSLMAPSPGGVGASTNGSLEGTSTGSKTSPTLGMSGGAFPPLKTGNTMNGGIMSGGQSGGMTGGMSWNSYPTAGSNKMEYYAMGGPVFPRQQRGGGSAASSADGSSYSNYSGPGNPPPGLGPVGLGGGGGNRGFITPKQKFRAEQGAMDKWNLAANANMAATDQTNADVGYKATMGARDNTENVREQFGSNSPEFKAAMDKESALPKQLADSQRQYSIPPQPQFAGGGPVGMQDPAAGPRGNAPSSFQDDGSNDQLSGMARALHASPYDMGIRMNDDDYAASHRKSDNVEDRRGPQSFMDKAGDELHAQTSRVKGAIAGYGGEQAGSKLSKDMGEDDIPKYAEGGEVQPGDEQGEDPVGGPDGRGNALINTAADAYAAVHKRKHQELTQVIPGENPAEKAQIAKDWLHHTSADEQNYIPALNKMPGDTPGAKARALVALAAQQGSKSENPGADAGFGGNSDLDQVVSSTRKAFHDNAVAASSYHDGGDRQRAADAASQAFQFNIGHSSASFKPNEQGGYTVTTFDENTDKPVGTYNLTDAQFHHVMAAGPDRTHVKGTDQLLQQAQNTPDDGGRHPSGGPRNPGRPTNYGETPALLRQSPQAQGQAQREARSQASPPPAPAVAPSQPAPQAPPQGVPQPGQNNLPQGAIAQAQVQAQPPAQPAQPKGGPDHNVIMQQYDGVTSQMEKEFGRQLNKDEYTDVWNRIWHQSHQPGPPRGGPTAQPPARPMPPPQGQPAPQPQPQQGIPPQGTAQPTTQLGGQMRAGPGKPWQPVSQTEFAPPQSPANPDYDPRRQSNQIPVTRAEQVGRVGGIPVTNKESEREYLRNRSGEGNSPPSLDSSKGKVLHSDVSAPGSDWAPQGVDRYAGLREKLGPNRITGGRNLYDDYLKQVRDAEIERSAKADNGADAKSRGVKEHDARVAASKAKEAALLTMKPEEAQKIFDDTYQQVMNAGQQQAATKDPNQAYTRSDGTIEFRGALYDPKTKKKIRQLKPGE